MTNHTTAIKTIQSPHLDAIPDELKARPRWMLWKYKLQPGDTKPAKMPVSAVTGKAGSSTNPKTWTTFDAAAAALAGTKPGSHGIAFVFDGDGVAGFDFDHCLDADGRPKASVAAKVAALDSYTERSVSGDGLHTIVFAPSLPKRGLVSDPDGHPDSFECYSTERFWVMTGDALAGTPATVNDADEAATAIRAAEENRRAAAKAAKATKPAKRTVTRQSGLSPYGVAALAAELDALRHSANGSRNNALNRAAYSLAQLVTGGELEWLTVESALLNVALDAGLGEGEATATIKSGMNAGAREPRSAPHDAAGAAAGAGFAYDGFGALEGDGELPMAPAKPALKQIDVTRQQRDIADDVLLALNQANDRADNPVIFVSGGALCSLVDADDDGRKILAHDRASFQHTAAQCADFIAPGKDDEPRDARPPGDTLAGILASGDWPGLPRLRALVWTPHFLQDGTLIRRPGYDPATERWLLGDCLPSGDMPIGDAVGLIDYWLQDFPFAGRADRAGAFGMLLQQFLTPWVADLNAPTPLWVISAATQGSGKTLLMELLAYVHAGRRRAVATMPKTDEEAVKVLVAAVMEQPSAVLFDNLSGNIASDALAGAITSSHYGGRRLGSNATASGRTGWLWAATANNPTLDADLARRGVLIRLESDSPQPDRRTGFAIPRIWAWTLEHRADLVDAALSIVNHWVRRGQPLGSATKGSFERWAEVLAGVLDAAGIDGFLANDDVLRRDTDAVLWEGFFRQWDAIWGSAEPGTDDPKAHTATANAMFHVASFTVDADGKRTADGLLDALLGDEREQARRVRLGQLLKKQTARVFDIAEDGEPQELVKFVATAVDRSNRTLYRLEKVAARSLQRGDSAQTPRLSTRVDDPQRGVRGVSYQPRAGEEKIPSLQDDTQGDAGGAHTFHGADWQETPRTPRGEPKSAPVHEWNTAESARSLRAGDSAAITIETLLAGAPVRLDQRDAAIAVARAAGYDAGLDKPITGGWLMKLRPMEPGEKAVAELGL